jgi:hypothetical protein
MIIIIIFIIIIIIIIETIICGAYMIIALTEYIMSDTIIYIYEYIIMHIRLLKIKQSPERL